MFSRFSRLNANGGVEIRLGCRSTVFVYRFYADASADGQTLVGLRSETSLGLLIRSRLAALTGAGRCVVVRPNATVAAVIANSVRATLELLRRRTARVGQPGYRVCRSASHTLEDRSSVTCFRLDFGIFRRVCSTLAYRTDRENYRTNQREPKTFFVPRENVSGDNTGSPGPQRDQ